MKVNTTGELSATVELLKVLTKSMKDSRYSMKQISDFQKAFLKENGVCVTDYFCPEDKEILNEIDELSDLSRKILPFVEKHEGERICIMQIYQEVFGIYGKPSRKDSLKIGSALMNIAGVERSFVMNFPNCGAQKSFYIKRI